MEIEKHFLQTIYSKLLEIGAALEVIELSRCALNDTQISSGIESAYIAVRSQRKAINAIMDEIDSKIYK